MNKKNIKKIFLLFIAIILAVPSIFVSANNTGGGSATGGKPGNSGSACPDCTWAYYYRGIRFSLYKYDGSNLTFYDSVDYCNSDNNCSTNLDNGGVLQTYNVGKIAYQNLNYDIMSDWKKDAVSLKNDASLKKNYLNYGYIGSGLGDAVKEFFKLTTNDSDIILKKIKEVFSNVSSLEKTNLGMIYITVEPTMFIHKSTNGKKFYGSAYELNSLFSDGPQLGNANTGLNGQIYNYMGSSVMASSIEGADYYKLVENLVELVPQSGLHSSGIYGANSTKRKENVEKITSKKGYGIVVYWIGNYSATASCSIAESNDKENYTLTINNVDSNVSYYDIGNDINGLRHNVQNNIYKANYSDTKIYGAIYDVNGNSVATCELQREYQTCASTCSGKSGDDLLSCAENYCQVASNNSSEKKKCIETCGVNDNGYKDPGFSGCDKGATILGNNTVCDADTTASNKTCIKANKNNYYKTVCTDKTTIFYGNSLPVTITPGTGFTYTPTVSGSKTCEMTFEVSKWKFDYASSYTDEERNKLINILNQYNDVSDNSIWSRDLNGTYTYKSNDADIEIEVTNSSDSNNSNKKTTKKLIADKTINLLDKKIKITSGGSYIIPLYNSGTSTKTALGIVKTESSNKTTYKLPGVCIDNKDGTIYDIKNNGKCDSINDGPYYSYYTNLKIKKGKYDTNTSVNKTSSSLNVKNTCNYNINLPVSCSIAVTECTESSPNKAELRIENKNNLNITYGLSHSGYELNNLSNYILNNSMKHLYGAIGVDGDIVATCSIDLNVPTCDLEPKPDPDYPVEPDNPINPDIPDKYTCTTKYSPSNYSEIKEYCSSSWMTDTANYASEKDCVNFCSTGANTCKNNPEVDTDDLESVTRFCSVKENRDANGYNKANYANPTLNEKHNIAMCINDCIDIPKDDDCLGIGCDYVYRPISLIDPFPNNRKAGYNWYGKEIYITDDLLNPVINPSGTEAEYIIELTPDIIKSINKNTDEYNKTKGKNAYIDYVYNDNEKEDGKYISKFIHSSDIENGGFGLYFTKK